MWMLGTFATLLSLYNLYNVDSIIYACVILGASGFIIGYYGIYLLKYRIVLKNAKVNKNYVLNKNIIKIFWSIVFIFYFRLFLKYIELMLQGTSWYSIRYSYFVRGKSFTEIESILSSYVMEPFVIYIIPIVITILILNKEKEWFIIFVGVLNVSIYFFCSQSKSVLITYLFVVIFVVLSTQNKRIREKRRKFKYIIFFLIVLVAFLIVYVQKRRETGNILQSLYSYVAPNLVVLEHYKKEIDLCGLQGYGVVLFYGIINIFVKFISLFGISLNEAYTQINSFLNGVLTNGIQVYKNGIANTNVLTTYLLYFYLDFRYIGIFFESMLLGMVTGKVEREVIKNKNLLVVSYYVLFAISIFKLYTLWQFYLTSYVMAYIFLFFVFKKE